MKNRGSYKFGSFKNFWHGLFTVVIFLIGFSVLMRIFAAVAAWSRGGTGGSSSSPGFGLSISNTNPLPAFIAPRLGNVQKTVTRPRTLFTTA